MLICPSGVDVSTASLRYLSACLRTSRRERGTRGAGRPPTRDRETYRQCNTFDDAPTA
ncbi:hypothetical protein GCM10023082_20410 [Streptomyces tremellae]|uniref:Uncharacterized protein n=1 Tax=Streptomyces tremellae TaxID=1124239 RepID=A0ABP7EQJ6_9ACTN